MTELPDARVEQPPRVRVRSARLGFSLARKLALIPAITLLLMGLILAVALEMGEQHIAALGVLDRDVFEPLSRAQTMKDEITLLHTKLFALLSIGNNEADPVAQKAAANAVVRRLEGTAAEFDRFLVANEAVSKPVASRLRGGFQAYAKRFRETADFAAYDASYGVLIAANADERFAALRADLDELVQSLTSRRAILTTGSISQGRAAENALFGLGVGATTLALLGAIAVGRGVTRPMLRLTGVLNRLASGDTELFVPELLRRDEIGAMAHALEVFRTSLIARRQADGALRRTHLQLDAALNSMLQGMLVWSQEHRVQLVNGRFFAMTGLPEGSIHTGLTVSEVIEISLAHGLYPGKHADQLVDMITGLLLARRSVQHQLEMRPGQFVQIAMEPMPDGGAVATFEDVTEKRRNEERIAFMARHDALTGLPNRTRFQEQMAAMLEARAEVPAFAVFCLDLDHFKEVNDTIGHPAGDDLLRLVTARLRQCVRDYDLVARLGGDEFAIVIKTTGDGPALAASLASRIVAAVGAPYQVQGHSVVIGASIGIALSEPGVSGADLLKRADVALYRAKEERGTFAFFESGMEEQLHARRGLEADLRLGLHRDEFELYYQPLYNLAEDRVAAFEALIRWNSPSRGRVSPADFIPLAEQTGLIIPIGEWVLSTACAEAARWPDHIGVAVNLSPIQTKNRHLVQLVSETLARTGLSADRLELEITETVLLQDTETVMTMLGDLHDLGVKVSMDDFGTGYSSLSYLRRFPFDKIKIDRSFISDLHGSAADARNAGSDAVSAEGRSAATIVRAIIGLGTNLGIATTAEGIETAQQLAQVRQNGCTEVQGYFISPPRPANEIAELIRRLDRIRPGMPDVPDVSPQLATCMDRREPLAAPAGRDLQIVVP
ncbi:MAG TPA: EAL domain-containing protein [Rhodopila sp.]